MLKLHQLMTPDDLLTDCPTVLTNTVSVCLFNIHSFLTLVAVRQEGYLSCEKYQLQQSIKVFVWRPLWAQVQLRVIS